jgi:peptide/nickel transport system substrate-binding protein
VDYQAVPVILQDLPDFDNGGARLEVVTVAEYEVYLNPETLLPENLRPGNPYLPAGCSAPECMEIYRGGEVQMERLLVDFQLQPRLSWSDGEPLTASDSSFSFELDSDRSIPTTKFLVDRTTAYDVIDETTVRWTGLPGYFDPEYATLFWTPLPRHQLGAIAVEDLLVSEVVMRNPLGWGPYQIEEWQSEDQLLMTKNPHYFRVDEGLPNFDRLLFRFLRSDSTAAIQQLLTGECDLVDESLLDLTALDILKQYTEEGRIQLAWTPAPQITRLDFNVAPLGRQGEKYFEDLRTRNAVAHCLDRAGLLEDLFLGYGVLPESYVAPGNPYLPEVSGMPPYDPEAGRSILTEMGWVDADEDEATSRVAYGVPGIDFATEFSMGLLSAEGELSRRSASAIQANLAACGIDVQVETTDFTTLTAPYPDGPVFGREFDAVLWSWPDWVTPLCEMFAGREIPSEADPFGINASGFNDFAYNQACERMLLGRVTADDYVQELMETVEIFSQALPGIPLYQAPRLAAYGLDVCGIEFDSLSFSVLFYVEQFDMGAECP